MLLDALILLSAPACALSAALRAKLASAGQIDGAHATDLAAPLKFLNCTTPRQWLAHKLTPKSA
jgi:hypothetical protein